MSPAHRTEPNRVCVHWIFTFSAALSEASVCSRYCFFLKWGIGKGGQLGTHLNVNTQTDDFFFLFCCCCCFDPISVSIEGDHCCCCFDDDDDDVRECVCLFVPCWFGYIQMRQWWQCQCVTNVIARFCCCCWGGKDFEGATFLLLLAQIFFLKGASPKRKVCLLNFFFFVFAALAQRSFNACRSSSQFDSAILILK